MSNCRLQIYSQGTVPVPGISNQNNQHSPDMYQGFNMPRIDGRGGQGIRARFQFQGEAFAWEIREAGTGTLSSETLSQSVLCPVNPCVDCRRLKRQALTIWTYQRLQSSNPLRGRSQLHLPSRPDSQISTRNSQPRQKVGFYGQHHHLGQLLYRLLFTTVKTSTGLKCTS